MEPFSIECTTCRARLKVRDESAIGQILTCPKCSSMVLVERPAEPLADSSSHSDLTAAAANQTESDPAWPPGQSAPGEPPAAPGQSAAAGQTAATGQTAAASGAAPPPPAKPASSPEAGALAQTSRPTSPPQPSPSPAKASPPHQSPPTQPTATAGSQADAHGPLSDTVEDLSVYGTQQPPPPSDSGQEIPLPTVPTPLASEPMLLPTDAWSSESSQRVRNWLLLGGAATLGIFVAVGVFALVAMSLSRSDEVAGETPGTSPTVDPGTDPDGPGPVVPVATPPPVATDQSQDPSAVPVDPSSDPGPAEIDPPADDVDPAPPTPPDPPDDEGPPGLVAVGSEDLPPGMVAGEGPIAADDESLDRTLRDFEALLDDKPPADDTPAIPDLEIDETGLPRPEPRFVNVAERLGDTFEEIQFEGTPLQEFLRFVTSFSTIPITLDPDAFFWLEATPATPVSAHQKSATVQQLVQAVVESVDLTTQVVGDQLLVQLPEEGVLPRSYALGDLASDESEMQTLALLLQKLVAPESWREAGGLGTLTVHAEELTIQQSTRVHRQVLRFLEKLRLARGLTLTSPLPPANFAATSRHARTKEHLAKPITLNFFQPTPIDRVIQRLAQAAGVLILIDWQSLHREGWNTNTTLTLTVSDAPLGQTLDEVLSPMGLGYRCVDTGMIQITTRSRLEREIDLEFYPVRDLVSRGDADALIAKLQAALEPVAPATLAYDAPSGTLLAALPQPGQIALEAALAKLRE